MKIEKIGRRIVLREAKALVDTLADGQAEADFKTLGDTLKKAEA